MTSSYPVTLARDLTHTYDYPKSSYIPPIVHNNSHHTIQSIIRQYPLQKGCTYFLDLNELKQEGKACKHKTKYSHSKSGFSIGVCYLKRRCLKGILSKDKLQQSPSIEYYNSMNRVVSIMNYKQGQDIVTYFNAGGDYSSFKPQRVEFGKEVEGIMIHYLV